MIIETSDNRFYRVTETGQEGLSHVWLGIRVNFRHGKWTVPVSILNKPSHRRQELVRKAATKVVEA
jgi:DNA-binding PadR family transcriptional regulator